MPQGRGVEGLKMLILLAETELEATAVVANCAMNRERRLASYERELGLKIVPFLEARESPSWLDLCCGQGRALVEAAESVPRGEYFGVDLVGGPVDSSAVTLWVGPWRDWRAPSAFDLITCVHGLHYVGDKLGALVQASQWLAPRGKLLCHFDPSSLRDPRGGSLGRAALVSLRNDGWLYISRRRLLSRVGPAKALGWEFVGADPKAGPNFTGQPAVNSHYRR